MVLQIFEGYKFFANAVQKCDWAINLRQGFISFLWDGYEASHFPRFGKMPSEKK